MSAHKAVELGFADDIFGRNTNENQDETDTNEEPDETKQENTPDEEEQKNASSFLFSRKAVNASLMNKLTKHETNGHSVAEIFDRLDTIQKFI